MTNRQQMRALAITAINKAASAVGLRERLGTLAWLLMDAYRRDYPNSHGVNGEGVIQECLARRLVSRPSPRSLVVDVGAHVGSWTLGLLDHLPRTANAEVLAFEPNPAAREVFRRAVSQEWRSRLILSDLALSDSHGTSQLWFGHELAGSASVELLGPCGKESIPVRTTTLDTALQGRPAVYIKVDAEGHDFPIMLGALESLKGSRVECMQFEYNYRWQAGRYQLRDAFRVAAECSMQLFKIVPRGLIRLTEWHPTLETYREGNYLIAQPQALSWLPRVVSRQPRHQERV